MLDLRAQMILASIALVWEQSGTGYRGVFRQTPNRSAYDWILDVAPGARNRLQGELRVRIPLKVE